MEQLHSDPPCTKDASWYDGSDRPDFEIKQLDDEGQFQGYASVFGVKDLQDEIVLPGAFKRSIKQKKGIFPFLYGHNHQEPIGKIMSAEEDERGLKISGKLALGVSRARDTLELMREKIIRSMSIGYRVVKDEFERETGVRRLKEIDLWEISAVLFPANPKARIQAVKTVVPYQNLPLDDAGRRWAAPAAENRVRTWAGASDKPNSKYRRAFVWFDAESPEEFGGYKLQIADVTDGELRAIPRAIFAAAAALQGARGGVDIPSMDKERAKEHLARYYRRLDRSPPWEGQSSMKEILRHVVDSWESLDDELRKDLRELVQAEANPSPEPFAWLEQTGIREPEPIGGDLIKCLDEMRSWSAAEE